MFEIISFHKNSTYLNDNVIMLLEHIFSNFDFKQRDAYILFMYFNLVAYVFKLYLLSCPYS